MTVPSPRFAVAMTELVRFTATWTGRSAGKLQPVTPWVALTLASPPPRCSVTMKCSPLSAQAAFRGRTPVAASGPRSANEYRARSLKSDPSSSTTSSLSAQGTAIQRPSAENAASCGAGHTSGVARTVKSCVRTKAIRLTSPPPLNQ